MFAWNDSYSVKVPIFDDQHKRLFSLVNDLNEAMKVGRARGKMGEILEDLLMYSKTHFREEEAAMISCGYAEFRQHKEEHDRFTKKAEELVKAHASGAAAISVELLDFLIAWLTNHIQATDKRYSSCLAL